METYKNHKNLLLILVIVFLKKEYQDLFFTFIYCRKTIISKKSKIYKWSMNWDNYRTYCFKKIINYLIQSNPKNKFASWNVFKVIIKHNLALIMKDYADCLYNVWENFQVLEQQEIKVLFQLR